MKLIIDGQEYDPVDPADITLAEGVLLRKQSIDFGVPVTLVSLGEAQRELRGMDKAALKDNPLMEIYAMVQIWLTRRRAGERLTFEQANAYTSLVSVVEPSDIPPEPDPSVPRRASVRGGKSQPKEAVPSPKV